MQSDATRSASSSARLAILGMLLCVLIYGSNFAISRHAVLNGLTTSDIVMLRFLTAGLLLLPLFLRRGGFADCAGLGWRKGLLITLMSGLPMTMLMIGGLALAPAAHGATITPGTVLVVGSVASIVLLGTLATPLLVTGIAIALAGLACIGFASSTGGGPDVLIGDLMFLSAGLVWGLYPTMLVRWRIDGLTATAVVAVVSLVLFAPWYIWSGGAFWTKPLGPVLFHAFNQGLLNVVLGLWLWAWAANVLGPGVAGRFPALIPVVGTLTAIPLLGEWPQPLQLLGMALVVAGLVLTSRSRVK
ncbi:MAG: DMT family transporter [Beijerinckiaceae bacterium]